jgi:hypothetical protein
LPTIVNRLAESEIATMPLPLIQKDLQEIATQQGLALPPRVRRDGKAIKTGASLPSDLRRAAHEALAGYRASSDYRDLIANLAELDLEQLQKRLATALHGPHFAPLMEHLRAPVNRDVDSSNFVPKAVSFGLLAQAVLIVGLSGSVGLVENIDPSNYQTAIYAGGAVDIGIDVGLEGDICLGFWTSTVDELSGLYIGGEVDIDDGSGVTVAFFLQDDEPALAFAGIDLGIDDGIENEDFYFFEFSIGRSPIYQPGEATYLVQFGSLTCNDSKDNFDTVYFNFQQDGDTSVTYRYPAWDGYQMCESGKDSTFSTWGVGLIAKFNESLSITLQVGDYTMPSQTITPGTFTKLFKWEPVPFKDYTDAHTNEIYYSLDVQLIKDGGS